MQDGVDKLQQVAQEKQAGGGPISAEDANRISSAERLITGVRVKGGLAAQTQSAVDTVSTLQRH